MIKMVAYGRSRQVMRYQRRPNTYTALAGIGRAASNAIRRQVAKRVLSSSKPKWVPRKRSRTSVKAKSKTYMPRYVSTGVYGRKFKKPTKYGVSQYLKFGYVEHVEKGGVTNSNNCVYIGHTFGAQKMINAVCGAIVRKLAEKAGYSVRAMNDKIQANETVVSAVSPLNLNYSYKLTAFGQVNVASIVAGADSRWDDLQTQLLNSFYSVVAVGGEDLILLRIWISSKDTAGDIQQVKQANMDLGSLLLDLNFSSKMTMQNRTLARTGGADESNANDIANNPIAGRSYTGRGNGAMMRVANNIVATNEAFLGNRETGEIDFRVDAGGGQVTAEQKEVFNRPPAKSAFQNVSATGSAFLNPGQMKTSSCYFKRKMYLSTFMNAVYKNIEGSTNQSFCTLGMFKIYAYEKRCNTGVDEPDISVGYEINSIYRARVSEIRKGINVVQTLL